MNKALYILLLVASLGYGQINSVGHRTKTFNDPTRTGGYGSGGGSGRQIQTEIYYPSSAAADGDSTIFSSGQYPVLIFGHGFVMDYSAYNNIWKDLVLQGYIMCFPRTEGSVSPTHTDFGKDLALIQLKMQTENTTSTSPFYQKIINKYAIMGHSMGGGSSFLACQNNTAPTTMVTFAAANTNPSSIAAATQVSIPTLLIAGQNDCVAPPATNQDSMYYTCAASCKVEITIKGAAHCEFANYNFNCSFGESTCSPSPTITSAQQHTIASFYYSNWLRYWLKDDCASYNLFLDSANNSGLVVSSISCASCTSTSIFGIKKDELRICPNPADLFIKTESNMCKNTDVRVYDVLGNELIKYTNMQKEMQIDISSLPNGVYFIHLGASTQKFIVQHNNGN